MSDDLIHKTASDVDHVPGEVMQSGPDGVAVSMTPDAAAETGARLLDHAAAASGEQAIADEIERRKSATQ